MRRKTFQRVNGYSRGRTTEFAFLTCGDRSGRIHTHTPHCFSGTVTFLYAYESKSCKRQNSNDPFFKLEYSRSMAVYYHFSFM